jgi:ABC-type Zn uptake system ZnuABC Zn-binding protein ZnuA
VKKKAIRRQLNTILAKLETMQVEIEEALAGQQPGDSEEYNANLRTYEVHPDETSSPASSTVDYANLRWRTQNPDGTWRDCIE